MQKSMIALICALLLSVGALSAPQSKAKKRLASQKQVTITLVRWPYT